MRTGIGRASACAVVAVLAMTAGCGSDDGASTQAPSTTAGTTGASFCSAWQGALRSGSEHAANAALRLAPPELARDAALLESAGSKSTPATDAAVKRVTDWITINCATGTGRHVAPPTDAELGGLKLCSVDTFPVPEDVEANNQRVVLYGRADLADPYAGPMIGVFSDRAGNGGFAGDGDPTPIVVRGHPGVAAPITVFQQSVVPDLGFVIAWTERGRDVGLFGRLWSKDRVAELGALASRLGDVDGKFAFRSDAMPDGYRLLFDGRPDPAWSLVATTLYGDYTVRYQAGRGTVTVSAAQTTQDQYDASRFFDLPLAHERIGFHNALVGSAWSKDAGPWVVQWRDPDGFTLRVTGLGAGREETLAVARHARDLSRAEWAHVVASVKDCGSPVP